MWYLWEGGGKAGRLVGINMLHEKTKWTHVSLFIPFEEFLNHPWIAASKTKYVDLASGDAKLMTSVMCLEGITCMDSLAHPEVTHYSPSKHLRFFPAQNKKSFLCRECSRWFSLKPAAHQNLNDLWLYLIWFRRDTLGLYCVCVCFSVADLWPPLTVISHTDDR